MTWLRWFGYALAACLVTWGLAATVGYWLWSGGTRELERRLATFDRPLAATRYHPSELEGLPPPVQRFFRSVLTEGQPIVTTTSLEHKGEFNMGEAEDNWRPFHSRQQATASRPGFIWDARVEMMPGVLVRVHDAYIGGEGLLHAALLGLVPVADLRGTPELAEGELLRWFAEAAWYPTALLPSQGVRWEHVSDKVARATLVDGAVSATLTFTFGDDGSMEVVRAEARGRTVGGRVLLTPWEGRWSDMRVQNGMRVPMRGEVAWLTPEGRKAYWRGTVTSLSYEFAP